MNITAKSQQIIDEIIVKADGDKRIPIAFSESDVVELALRLLKTCNEIDTLSPVGMALLIAVKQFNDERGGQT